VCVPAWVTTDDPIKERRIAPFDPRQLD